MAMLPSSLAALRAAIADDRLGAWLAAAPDPARARLRGALAIDRPLWREHPDSLASCLLARTFGDPDCAELHAAWLRELAAGDTPWIRPLRALPVPDGLLAELRDGAGISLAGLHRPSFLSDDEVIVVANRFHPTVQAPELRQRDRLRWSWRRGQAVIEADPDADLTAPQGSFPRVETDGWGPAYLRRSPDSARIALPCPEDGSADAHFTADGTRLIVYGTLDEYAGGFVYIVDATTLAIERRLATSAPVAAVLGSSPARLLVSTHRNFTLAWFDGRATVIDLGGDALCLSPDGAHAASLGDGLRVWSLAELVRRAGSPPRTGFPPRFDPDGERLLCGTRLLDARDGHVIAELEPELGPYLEGGPAQPWLHLGTRHLVCTHGGLQIWDTRSGVRKKVKQRIALPHWYSVAHDRASERLAVLRKGEHEVHVHSLPGGASLQTLRFDLAGVAVAISPDASLVAVHEGPAVEVRRAADGSLLRRLGQAPAHAPRDRYGRESLRFSADGRRVASFVDGAGDDDSDGGSGWWIRSLDGDDELYLPGTHALAELADFADPQPRDWTLAVDTRSLFTHTPSGVRIALPIGEPWVFNPADPTIVACGAFHGVLQVP